MSAFADFLNNQIRVLSM